MLTVAAITIVAVTAATIGQFPGGDVTIGGMASSTVTYSDDNATWATTLTSTSTTDPWYARLEVPAGGSFSGPVEITWQLQQKTGPGAGDWTDVGSSQLTSIVLSGGEEQVYASSDGSNTDNHDWATEATAAGTYRVYATVDSQ
jgi:hypothetical protein